MQEGKAELQCTQLCRHTAPQTRTQLRMDTHPGTGVLTRGSQPVVCSSCYRAASTSDGHTGRAPGRITVGSYGAFPLY